MRNRIVRVLAVSGSGRTTAMSFSGLTRQDFLPVVSSAVNRRALPKKYSRRFLLAGFPARVIRAYFIVGPNLLLGLTSDV